MGSEGGNQFAEVQEKVGREAGIMRDIYVITYGEYDDYRILYVTDDLSLADKFVSRFYGNVETWLLNQRADDILNGLECFEVRLNEMGEVEKCAPLGYVPDSDRQFIIWRGPAATPNKLNITVYIWAKSCDEATRECLVHRDVFLSRVSDLATQFQVVGKF